VQFPPDLIRLLRAAKNVAALTGAGVSQESGLRTFRDAMDGLWSQYRPEDLATPEAFERTPELVWEFYAMRRLKAAKGWLSLILMERWFVIEKYFGP
jgi:NAD-dependent deacetylase